MYACMYVCMYVCMYCYMIYAYTNNSVSEGNSNDEMRLALCSCLMPLGRITFIAMV